MASHQAWYATVNALFGQDVPDDDQEFASDGDDGFVPTDAHSKLIKLFAPLRIVADGSPSGFDESVTEFLATLFGDAPGAIGLTGSVNASAKSSIANEFLGRGEAVDVADGAEYDQGSHHADARKLDQIGHRFDPRIAEAELMKVS